MSSTTDALRQVFPHLSEDTITSVVEELRPNFPDHPERLLDRATSELLRGNFPLKKPKPVEDLTVDQDVIHVAAVPSPARDLQLEKAEILQFVEDLAPNVDTNWLSKHYDTLVLNGDRVLRSKDRIQELLANYILEHSDYPKKASSATKVASAAPVDYSKYDQAVTSADYRTNWCVTLIFPRTALHCLFFISPPLFWITNEHVFVLSVSNTTAAPVWIKFSKTFAGLPCRRCVRFCSAMVTTTFQRTHF